ncbi:MAG: hypothetical protein B7X41_00315 [Microbacterium sp. 14-71-5]|jgi:hypothetical protein|uniref:DUF5684 domain-containing protein n=1 Tax=unclassified Microbacterium TaxID=2609290 RepID=UPI000BDCA940|nr:MULTISPECIES: DUF5684 domain-containing protein [unclassified Microbacterium]OZB85511.1 MAG: hypothetical protein B7X32_03130 [Microbacterium sp. 13-71-7]OZB89906.1 MAG: hypothetical protein B7X41_00315 [Microbacterium sp. 14-71-5]
MNIVHASDATDAVSGVYAAIFSGTGITFSLILYVIIAIALWRVFTKAGHPGILAIIPIVNLIFLIKIAGMSGWLVLLYLIPLVNIIFAIVVAVKLGKNFGKGGVFSFFLLWLFSFIGYFIIGFGSAEYRRV